MRGLATRALSTASTAPWIRTCCCVSRNARTRLTTCWPALYLATRRVLVLVRERVLALVLARHRASEAVLWRQCGGVSCTVVALYRVCSCGCQPLVRSAGAVVASCAWHSILVVPLCASLITLHLRTATIATTQAQMSACKPGRRTQGSSRRLLSCSRRCLHTHATNGAGNVSRAP